MDKKIIKKAGKYFTQEDQHSIIQEMISNGLSKKQQCQAARPDEKQLRVK